MHPGMDHTVGAVATKVIVIHFADTWDGATLAGIISTVPWHALRIRIVNEG